MYILCNKRFAPGLGQVYKEVKRSNKLEDIEASIKAHVINGVCLNDLEVMEIKSFNFDSAITWSAEDVDG